MFISSIATTTAAVDELDTLYLTYRLTTALSLDKEEEEEDGEESAAFRYVTITN